MWKRVVVVLIGSLLIGNFVGMSIVTVRHWYKDTVWMWEMDVRFIRDRAYNTGKYHERLCSQIRQGAKKDKTSLNPTQQEFCDRHDDYKNHPDPL